MPEIFSLKKTALNRRFWIMYTLVQISFFGATFGRFSKCWFFQLFVLGKPWRSTFLLSSPITKKLPLAQYEVCDAILTLDLVNVVLGDHIEIIIIIIIIIKIIIITKSWSSFKDEKETLFYKQRSSIKQWKSLNYWTVDNIIFPTVKENFSILWIILPFFHQ